MCNINMIYKKDKIKSAEVVKAMNIISYNSFLTNSHGEGIIDSSLNIHKGINKIFLNGEDYFLVSHQRLATSGTKDMLHPHESKDLLLMHNGIFHGLGNNKESDSRVYLDKLQKVYEENNYDIIKAIKELHETINGSYSIILYEKQIKRWIYYKNNTTSFYMFNNKNYMIASTKRENIQTALITLTNTSEEFKQLKKLINKIHPVKSFNILNLLTLEVLGKIKEEKLCIKSDDIYSSDENFYKWLDRLKDKKTEKDFNYNDFYTNSLYNYY